MYIYIYICHIYIYMYIYYIYTYDIYRMISNTLAAHIRELLRMTPVYARMFLLCC